MATLATFRALRYDPARVPDLAAAVAPPYDVISPEARERYARHPHSVVRLTLPQDDPPGPGARDRYARAGAAFAAWRAEGVLQRDPEPSLYPYEQAFEVGGRTLRRRGVLGLLRLAHYAEKQVLPHERTFARYKDDRLRLMRACPANLEAILGFYAGPGQRIAALLEAAMQAAPLAALRDADGVGHRLWRLAGAPAAELCGLLRDRPVAIADGHHRYETALNFRGERLAGLPDAEARRRPEAFVLAHLVHAEDPGLVILPTHRLVRRAAPLAALRPRLARRFEVEELPAAPGEALAVFRRALADLQARRRCEIAFLAAGKGGELLRLRLRDLPPEGGQPSGLARLDVAVLHALVLEGLLEIPAGDPDAISYERDEAAVLAAVEAGAAPVAFGLSAPRPDEVLALALAGQRMPQKSTFFYPKVLSGLVLHPLDEGDVIPA
ncbi:MAG: DUF1015 family protein [Candidatus Methylomirabilales bacterium]